jgi:hypothetical protein
MEMQLEDGPPRRIGDALRYEDDDTSFARGVKELAHLRGWSALRLGKKLAEVGGGAQQSTVSRILLSKKPRRSTAETFASAFKVAPTYLSVLAQGLPDIDGPLSYKTAVRVLRALIEEAGEWLIEGAQTKIFDILASMPTHRAHSIVFEAYRAELRRAVLVEFGRDVREPAVVVLQRALRAGKIDLKPYLNERKTDFYETIYAFATGFTSKAEALRMVLRARTTMKALGTWTRAYDESFEAEMKFLHQPEWVTLNERTSL